jgi:hypothetical protein
MLTPELIQKLADKYGLAVGLTLHTPDDRYGTLLNVGFEPDIGVVQYQNEDGGYVTESFPLSELSSANSH